VDFWGKKSNYKCPEIYYTKHKVFDRYVAVAWYIYIYKGTVSSKSITSATRFSDLYWDCEVRKCYQVTAKNFARGFSRLLGTITTKSQSAAAGCLKHVVYGNVFHNDWWIGVYTMSCSPTNVLSQVYWLLYYANVIQICINVVLLSELRFEELV